METGTLQITWREKGEKVIWFCPLLSSANAQGDKGPGWPYDQTQRGGGGTEDNDGSGHVAPR
jgi:hypothetical protein